MAGGKDRFPLVPEINRKDTRGFFSTRKLKRRQVTYTVSRRQKINKLTKFFYSSLMWPSFSSEITHVRTQPSYQLVMNPDQIWWRLKQKCDR
jgi:hypothetical protein